MMGYETTQAFEQAMKDGLIKSTEFIPKYFELLKSEARLGLANMRKTSKFARENFNRTIEILTQKLFTEGLEVGLVRFFNLFTEMVKYLEPAFVFVGRTIRDFTESLVALTKLFAFGNSTALTLTDNTKKFLLTLGLLLAPMTRAYTLIYLFAEGFNKVVKEVSAIVEIGLDEWLAQQKTKFSGWLEFFSEWGYGIGAIIVVALLALGKLSGMFSVKLPFAAGVAVKAIDKLTGSIGRLATVADIASGGASKDGSAPSSGRAGKFLKSVGAMAAIPLGFAGIGMTSEQFVDQAKTGDTASQLGLMAGQAASGAMLGVGIGSFIPLVGTAAGAGIGALGGLAYANYQMYADKMNLMKGTPFENKPTTVDNKLNLNITIKDGKPLISATDGLGRPINPNSVSLKYADQ